MTTPPKVIEGSYTADIRTLEYWTQCEHCPERKDCRHDCDHPGWIRFVVDGRPSVFRSGIITLRNIEQMVRDYLENDPPEDVNYPPATWRQTEMRL